ncbi:helix-turn-helix domain-containing protein [Nocardia asteroides NBRC 15531]|uniref:DNA-binding protein n=1 Tax=Nocardia asteroides NBRC 15531 TaxID=1110697 RepID=U5E5P1_NOCAS|nr:helix-turn-helix transcriptional regulator [Nocardia asteroides]TLF70360.1 helix-turn-helix domain-containing protein [Nocardia asteroides NBRC 15531]UGT49891.1 helix-turn-helix transcriptional regulator [Nocardia asteroides]SFN26163.1 Transcriptional regulator, contains XRE-family HTH domain [Nocardia asteroides]VEG37356.1 Helix-turn-helix [Nocardia asteroides]GAD81583.1 putative DNA-binding protein [Nocardia asteroides NBRC 15531]
MSDNELGLFLRTRREAVTPAEVGLPAGPRRRTPGLRRAEVAMLAGVSVEYLIRLEQGRDRHPSAPVLSALAETLRLSPRERVHLHQLTKGVSGFNCGAAENGPNRTVRPTVRAILDQLDPAPAAITNRFTEVLACTAGYRTLMTPSGLFEQGEPANVARFVFTHPGARELYPDWDDAADKLVASLKQGPFRADPMVAALVDELTVTAGAPFTDRLASLPGLPPSGGINRIRHPEAGTLRLAYESLELSLDDDQSLYVLLPADEASATALDRLVGRHPGGLRAVAS